MLEKKKKKAVGALGGKSQNKNLGQKLPGAHVAAVRVLCVLLSLYSLFPGRKDMISLC